MYSYDSNDFINPSSSTSEAVSNIPSGSKLAQYIQGGSKNVNRSIGGSNVQQFVPMHQQRGLISDSTSSFTPAFSQMSISGRNDLTSPEEDNVSAFLNGNYSSTTDYYQTAPSACGVYPDLDEDREQTYYAYQSQPSHIWKSRLKSISTFFIDPQLKAEIIARQLTLQAYGVDTTQSVPQVIEHFHNVTQISSSSKGVLQETVYRGIKANDGLAYCLRRIATPRLFSQKQLMTCENWKRLAHSNVVQLREVIHTRAFHDNSYLFVYDFHPLADTLKTRHFGKGVADHFGMLNKFQVGAKYTGLPEAVMWNYVIQLSSAIRYIHASGLAIRSLDVSRLLLISRQKILIGSCGMADVLQSDNPCKGTIVAQQVEDLRFFGHILLILFIGKLNAAYPENIGPSMQYVEQNCSVDLRNIIQLLCVAKAVGHKVTTISDIMPMVGARFYGHIENMQLKIDYLEDELSKEVENGRLFRLLCKLNTVNERPDNTMWSETSDRYLLKLFRDYVFHQINENGKPWVDMSHIALCLNKLDAGVEENIQLLGRDGDNVLIVSYAELRKCLENSFNALVSPQFSMIGGNGTVGGGGMVMGAQPALGGVPTAGGMMMAPAPIAPPPVVAPSTMKDYGALSARANYRPSAPLKITPVISNSGGVDKTPNDAEVIGSNAEAEGKDNGV